MQVASRCH